jgi:hypothetical protein
MSSYATIPPFCGTEHFPFSAPTRPSNPLRSACNVMVRNHVFPPFVLTLRPCCKRTRHLRVFPSKICMVGSKQSTLRSISHSLPSSNTIRRSRLLVYLGERLCLTDDEDKQMALFLTKNYALESLPDIDLDDEAGDVDAILRLNEAGRRYLIEDGSSISKGVEVLSRVNNESIAYSCIFWRTRDCANDVLLK